EPPRGSQSHAAADNRMASVDRGGDALKPVMMRTAVGIREDQNVAAGKFDAAITRGLRQQSSPMLFEDDFRILCRHARGSFVWRAVDEDSLEISIGLRAQRREASGYGSAGMVGGNDDGDARNYRRCHDAVRSATSSQ